MVVKKRYTAEEMCLQENERFAAVHSIYTGFIWGKTPQGPDYWAQVICNLESLPEDPRGTLQ